MRDTPTEMDGPNRVVRLDCQREFATIRLLDVHRRAKHPETVNVEVMVAKRRFAEVRKSCVS